MTNLRWYDKDRYLSAFMKLMETLPEAAQQEIAQDVLKSIPKVISIDYDIFIEFVENNDPKKFNRWYDKNPFIHKTVEAIRQLSESEREALYLSISDTMQSKTELHLEGLKLKNE